MSAESTSADLEEQTTEESTEAASTEVETAAIETEGVAEAPTPERVETDVTLEATAGGGGDALESIRGAMQSGKAVTGEVVGSDDDDLHVVVDGVTAFCPHSEMEIGEAKDAEHYVDRTFDFFVLSIDQDSDRVLLSRVSHLRQQLKAPKPVGRQKIEVGAILTGKVVTVKEFGAFVELGGTQGLVHISELARRRVERTEDVVQPGDEVEVKVLKVDKGGRRISLSMRALEPDPWKGVAQRFQTGMTVEGTVEKVERFGAFIQLEPGLSGLLPSSKMTIPRDSSASRVFLPGRKVNVKIVSVDPRRQRISLGLEGDASEGSREDYESYKQNEGATSGGFNALAAALSKLQQ